MGTLSRPLLRLKGHELVPPEEDRRVDLDIFDVLLPCRFYEVNYKVASLGHVSPTLEFLLRLVKAAPGIAEEDAASFFGYSPTEVAYVLEEAVGPGYLERRVGRLWLTISGEGLFKEDEDQPSIYTVEARRRSFGFDLMAIAPQVKRFLDELERVLPELPSEDPAGTGRVAERVPARFKQFFRELADQADRGKTERRDIYSIDPVVNPGERYQMPLRVVTFAQASSPSAAEIDLSSWRMDHEIADRPEIERAVAMFVKDQQISDTQLDAASGYQTLIDLAPEFLKEFTTRNGLSELRYWREAVSRAGEPRTDRKTIPIVGSLLLPANIERLQAVLDYGLRNVTEAPASIYAVAPQTRWWGATTQQRDLLTLIQEKTARTLPGERTEMKSICLYAWDKPPQYIVRAFDAHQVIRAGDFPNSLELLLVPGVMVAAIIHSPLGASSGNPVPMGLASFDPLVIDRAYAYFLERYESYQSKVNPA
ncbi:hypothetical protein HJB56_29110 [Rhizobium lentis]|uniref:hypothetical protein n=1 Tax=Rhizobium lentis TaxID=1138194 RepID=UPI001C83925A|nr:hypothetical protein [Rhizobium lentis]MBX5086788.1 hypothetical protein [Rhizobium lentis]MBX5099433.1 hypothetical protein [Rhizobium lentis]MBX5124350.1 hypothetical protein [Rhizobium lentis]